VTITAVATLGSGECDVLITAQLVVIAPGTPPDRVSTRLRTLSGGINEQRLTESATVPGNHYSSIQHQSGKGQWKTIEAFDGDGSIKVLG